MRRSVTFLGCKWQVVDFVDKNQPPESRMSDSINKMLIIYKIAAYFIKALEIMNFVLDSLFIKKLFDKVFVEADIDDGTDENGSFFDMFFAVDTTASGRWMLITTISSAATTIVFGPILLKLIERYDPNKYDLNQLFRVDWTCVSNPWNAIAVSDFQKHFFFCSLLILRYCLAHT
jgi:hypothetical protein